MSTDGKVVVVGGGMAGLTAVRALEKALGPEVITLVEPREYAEIPIAMLRALVDPDGLGLRVRKPWTELSGVHRVPARATAVEGDELVVSSGERLTFGQLIVATGSTTKGYPFIKGGGADSIADRQEELRGEAARLREAGKILIIGGGPIGVELAGEIASAFPDKDVTLIDKSTRLLPALPAGAGKKAERVLAGRGVRVIVGSVLEQSGSAYVAPGGARYEPDLVVNATGIRTDGIPVDGGSSLNELGQLKVDSNLRVTRRTNVFAIGDVNDVPEIKLAATARAQAGTAVRNILALRKNPDARLKSYSASKPMGFITLGRKGGIVQLPFGRMDFMIGLKQKDMLVSMYLGK